MALSMRFVFVLCAGLIFLASGAILADLDPKVLEQQVNMDLRDTSMANAVAMLVAASDLRIVAPGEPESGIRMLLNGQTVRQVLDGLSAATGLKWMVQEDMIVFTKPEKPAEAPKKPDKPQEPLTPQQGMAQMIASLDSTQFYALSSGYPMGYADMGPDQQEILRSMLSAPTVGVDQFGEIVNVLPTPEQARIAFVTLPYLQAPGAEGKGALTLRLDSTPYIVLRREAK